MAYAADYLQTRIENKTAADVYLGFLPPHGRTVGASSFIEIDGDLVAQLRHPRDRSALNAALVAGTIEISRSPAVIIRDDGATPVAQKLVYDSDTVTAGEKLDGVAAY